MQFEWPRNIMLWAVPSLGNNKKNEIVAIRIQTVWTVTHLNNMQGRFQSSHSSLRDSSEYKV